VKKGSIQKEFAGFNPSAG